MPVFPSPRKLPAQFFAPDSSSEHAPIIAQGCVFFNVKHLVGFLYRGENSGYTLIDSKERLGKSDRLKHLCKKTMSEKRRHR